MILADLGGLAAGVLADGSTDGTLKAAVIAGVCLVASTSLPVLLSRREREPRIVRLMQADAATKDRQLRRQGERISELEAQVDTLQRYCWQNGIDPDTGQPVPPRPVPA